MKPEILFFEDHKVEEQNKGWEIYLAILSILVELDIFGNSIQVATVQSPNSV